MRTAIHSFLALLSVGPAFSLFAQGSAMADAQVTLCQVDTEVGTGVNLRDAIASGGKITFACPPQSVIRVTQLHDLFAVTEIDGENRITLDGGESTSIFVLGRPQQLPHLQLPFGSFTLRNLAIRRGKPEPGRGAITITFPLSSSHFTLDHVEITETERPVLVVAGTFVVKNSRFIDNNGPVLDFRSSVSLGPNSTAPFLVSKGTVSISNSSFQHNRGSALQTDNADVTLESIDVLGRSDPNERGSVFKGGSVTIRNSRFRNVWSNSQCGGALQSSGQTNIANTVFSGNRSSCGGGAVYVSGPDSDTTLRAVTFESNESSGRGGAISFDEFGASIQVKFSEFRNNRADFGGALAINAAATLHADFRGSGLSFKNNSATRSGAALYVSGANFQLSRGIFVENRPAAGGVLTFAVGHTPPFVLGNLLVARNAGPMALEGAVGNLVNSTVADNDGVGIQVSGKLRVANSVIANNKKQNCQLAGSAAALIDGGANLQFPGGACDAIPSSDPLLDNFYVPDPSSPLQGAGLDPICQAAPVFNRDVYGQRRPRSVHCTIGAVEGDIDQLIRRIGLLIRHKLTLGHDR